MTSSVAEAFKQVNYDTAKDRLYVRASELLRKDSHDDLFSESRQLITAVKNDAELLMALIGDRALLQIARNYLRGVRADMKSVQQGGAGQSQRETHATPARDNSASNGGGDQNVIGSHGLDVAVKPNDARGGRLLSGTQSDSAPFRVAFGPTPVHRLSSVRGALKIEANILSSYRVRDGRVLGRIRWHELPKLASENVREGKFLMLVYRSRSESATDPFAIVGDIVKDEDLQRFLQKAAEMQDDAEKQDCHA